MRITGLPSGTPDDNDVFVIDGTNGARKITFDDLIKSMLGQSDFDNAGFHNSVYRGKSLGSAVSAEQYTAISNGTFDDMFIGDYWTIGGVNYRIAHFDYYLHKGNTECTTHHVTLVPDNKLYDAQMNTSNVTTGGYVGSAMYTSNLNSAKSTINTAFNGHVLSHRQYLTNAVTSGYPSGGSWYDSTVELMNEINVYGCPIFTAENSLGATIPANYTIDNSQFALFAFAPDKLCTRSNWWLRDVCSSAYFAVVASDGLAGSAGASDSSGVRPAFSIKG